MEIIADFPAGIPNTADLPVKEVDGWTMRDDFLRLPRTLEALLTFLNRYGSWSHHAEPHRARVADAFACEPGLVAPDEIWTIADDRKLVSLTGLKSYVRENIHLHDLLRWGLTCGAGAWFQSSHSRAHGGIIGPRPKFPHFTIEAKGCLGVLLTTITLDYLSGTTFRICARGDCGMPFALLSQHKRIYCSPDCAHVVAVRNSRDKAKRKQQKPRRKS